MKVYSRRKVISIFVTYAFLGGMLLFILSPIIWTLITSFQPSSNLMVAPPRIEFSQVNLSFYQQLVHDPQFRKALANSLIVITTSTVIGLFFAALGAYSIARYRFKGKVTILFALFSIQLAPALALLIPLFIIMRGFGLIDTYPGLILTFLLFQVPVSIWLLRGFFHSIPAELYDAAMIDGCSRLATFFKIALPLAAPGLGATAIYMFIGGWNDLFGDYYPLADG